MNDFVVRLHRALVDALQQRAVRLDMPVTVAEIYQELIPYRLVRSFGFALNADYEFALLQMLAGEGNLLRIEPPEVREELRLELLSPNPNVGMFRQYAACDVFVIGEDVPQAAAPARAPERKQDGAQRPDVPHDWLLIEEQRTSTAQPAAPRTAGDKTQKEAVSPPPPPSVAPAPAAAQRPAPVAQTVKAKAAEVQPEPAAKPSAPAKLHPAATGAARVGCSACGHALPGGRSVRFCPNCGKEQHGKCKNCGEELEPAWRFCVGCGTPQ